MAKKKKNSCIVSLSLILLYFKCPFCPTDDSYIHAFWTCCKAQELWCHFQHLLNFQPSCSTWKDFMQSWLRCSHYGALGKILPLLFYFIIWEIWKLRTNALYGHFDRAISTACSDIISQVNYAAIKMKLRKQVEEDAILESSGVVHSLLPALKKQFQLVRWMPPIDTHLKINCDGSSFGNPGPGGGGFVIRNSSGRVLRAGYEAYGICTNMEAEVKAMHAGILHCLDLAESNMIVESDSFCLIQILLGESDTPWKYLADILDLKRLISEHHIQLQHIYREGNSVADFLAKKGSSQQDSQLLDCTQLEGALGLLVLRDNLNLPAI